MQTKFRNMMFILGLALLIMLTIYLIWYTVLRKSDLPPGPLKLPLIGNVWWFVVQKRKKVRIPVAMCELADKHGGVIHFQIGKDNLVFLQGFDAINEAFIKQADDFSCRLARDMEDIQKQGNGVIMENGKPHKVMQSFIIKFLNSETARIEEKVLEEVDAATDFLNSEVGGALDMGMLLSMMLTNITNNILFSKRYDYSDETLHQQIRDDMKDWSTALIPKLFLKLARNDKGAQGKQKVDNVIEEVANHEATYNENNLRDFVDVYMKERLKDPESNIFTLDRLYSVIKDLFVAGSQSASVNWTILYMQEYPELQLRCQQEINEKCGDRIIRLTDRGTLPYLESTLMEIQRMTNVEFSYVSKKTEVKVMSSKFLLLSAETSLAHTTDKDTSFRGYRIPKGSIVIANVLSSNKDRKYWDEPNLFIPDRFLQKDGQNNPAFIPFGLGARRCMGESLAKKQIFLIFTNLLQRFSFQREDQNVKHTFGCIAEQLTATPLSYKTKPIRRS